MGSEQGARRQPAPPKANPPRAEQARRLGRHASEGRYRGWAGGGGGRETKKEKRKMSQVESIKAGLEPG